jgi:hypothetical protein
MHRWTIERLHDFPARRKGRIAKKQGAVTPHARRREVVKESLFLAGVQMKIREKGQGRGASALRPRSIGAIAIFATLTLRRECIRAKYSTK